MNLLRKLLKRPAYFFVISHERSGTHFLINCIKHNTTQPLQYHSVGEWFGPFDQPATQFAHIESTFASLDANRYYVLKSHCDRPLFESHYPQNRKAIYIFRDYKDVLTSYYHFIQDGYLTWAQKRNPHIPDPWFTDFSEFLRKPLPDFLRYNYSIQGEFATPAERWLSHVTQWLNQPPANTKIITYNQLYFETEKVAQELIQFLGLPAADKFTHPRLDNSYIVMPRKGIVGDWKNQFSAADLELVEQLMAPHRALLNQYPLAAADEAE